MASAELVIEVFGKGMHYAFLDEDFGRKLLDQCGKRLICKFNGEMQQHLNLNRIKEGGYYIYIGKGVLKHFQLKEGDTLQVEFSKDDSEYQFEFPEELKEVLDTDPEAMEIFQSLTPGNQRGLIHLINKVKSSQLRIDKALLMAERLKMGITSPRDILKREL